MEDKSDQKWLTTEGIANKLDIHVKTVRHWINTGELPAIDVGGEYRISPTDFDEFIARRRIQKQKKA